MTSISSGSSTPIQSCGSEEELQQAMVQRRLKRKQSNRESARRSRQRKQQLLDDLAAQAAELKNDNEQILARLSSTTQQCVKVESENSVLRTQTMELHHRLNSLNEIVNCLQGSYIGMAIQSLINPELDGGLQRAWNTMQGHMKLPVMASADVFQY